MADYATTISSDDSATEPKKKGQDAGKWQDELIVAEKELRKFWENGRKIIKRYMVEMENNLGDVGTGRYNIFWSNVGVLKASLYANPPKPLVKRKFDDFMDDAARVAALMMERMLQQGFHKPESDMQVAFTQTVDDRLIPGLGQIWLRYCPNIVANVVAMDESGEPITEEIVDNEYVLTDYLYWEDFLFSPARTWEEVWWVARRVWMKRKEFRERFSEDLEALVTWTKKPQVGKGDRVTPETTGSKEQTMVFEIWDKTQKKVCWVSKECPYYLDECDDPLELENFFPCPKPLLATHTTSSLVPRADYIMVQTQYRRLDNLEVRIGLLEDAIRAAGVYDKANNELQQLLGTSPANIMIPVDNFGMFAEKGGLKGAVDWFPVDMVVLALDKLREVFSEEKVKLYELTGISDIMRGSTSPRETYGAQKLKAQYSSVRLQYLQGEVAEFVQQGLRIKAEIIAKHFQPENIVKNSLIQYTPDAEYAEAAVKIIKSEWDRCYRIEVHADTLAIPDFQAEQASRLEFITATGQFLSQAVQMIEMAPEAGPYLVRILQWGIASFRSAQSIEGVFDKAARALENKLKQPPPPPPPNPQLITAEAKAAKTKSDIHVQEEELLIAKQEAGQENIAQQQEIANDAARAQLEVGTMREKAAVDIQAQREKNFADIVGQREKTAADIEATHAKTAATVTSINAKAAAQAKAIRARPKASTSSK